MNVISKPVLVADQGVFASLGSRPSESWEATAVSCEIQNTLVPLLSYMSRRIQYEAGDIFALVTDGVLETGEDLMIWRKSCHATELVCREGCVNGNSTN
jgi:hypothetical protein